MPATSPYVFFSLLSVFFSFFFSTMSTFTSGARRPHESRSRLPWRTSLR
jgi:hypothetical protein